MQPNATSLTAKIKKACVISRLCRVRISQRKNPEREWGEQKRTILLVRDWIILIDHRAYLHGCFGNAIILYGRGICMMFYVCF